MAEATEGGVMDNVIRIDEGRIRDRLGEMVRGTVEEALDAMLDADAGRPRGAARCEGDEGRRDTRAGGCERSPRAGAGAAKPKTPRLRRRPSRRPLSNGIGAGKAVSRRL